MKVAVFDLETTKLVGDVGRVLCGSVYSVDEDKMYTYKIDANRPYDDRKVCRQVRDKLENHDLVVTWYGKGFDIPMLRTRLAQNDMNTLEKMFHIDVYYYFRGWRGLKPRNAKLATVVEFFDLGERKDDLDVKVWADAMGGKKSAIDRLCDRCESDVRLTYEVYRRALDLGLVANISKY